MKSRASLVVIAGAGVIAAGAAFIWRKFLRRSPAAVASPEQPGLKQLVGSVPDMTLNDEVEEKKLCTKKAKYVNPIVKVIRAAVAEKDRTPASQLCEAPRTLHPGHPASPGPKRCAFVTHLAAARRHRTTRRNELGLPAALEQALRCKIEVETSARCRQQQASTLKTSLAKNRQQLGHAKKAPKSYADNGRKAPRNYTYAH